MFTYKLKVLRFDEKIRTYTVQYYTDAIKNHYETVELPPLIENVKLSVSPPMSDQEAEVIARQRWPMGEVRQVTVYDESLFVNTAALQQYFAEATPIGILQHRENCLSQLASPIAASSAVGMELQISSQETVDVDGNLVVENGIVSLTS